MVVAGILRAAQGVGRVAAGGGDHGVGDLDLAHPAQGELLERGSGADEVLDELVGGLGEDPFGGVVLDDLGALAEHDDPVAELHGLVEVVGDDDHRLAHLVLDADELVLQALAGDRVDRSERFVHEQDGWVGGERPGHSHALLLAAGELLGIAVLVHLGIEADEVEQLVDAGVDPGLVPAEHAGHQGDVLGDAHVREEAAGLDDVADAAAQLVPVDRGDVLVAEHDAAVAGLDEPVDHLQRRGLPAARGAHEHDHLALGDLERHAVDGGTGLSRVALGDVVQADRAAGDLLVRRGGGVVDVSHRMPFEVVSRPMPSRMRSRISASRTTPTVPVMTDSVAPAPPRRESPWKMKPPRPGPRT